MEVIPYFHLAFFFPFFILETLILVMGTFSHVFSRWLLGFPRITFYSLKWNVVNVHILISIWFYFWIFCSVLFWCVYVYTRNTLFLIDILLYGLPWWLSGKDLACNVGNRFDPWVMKIPRRRKWQSTPVFLPGKSHGQRRLTGYSS